MKRFSKIVAWLVFAVCFAAWLLDFFVLAVSSGGRHYTQAEWNSPEVVSRMQSLHLAIVLFYILSAALFADIVVFWFLHRRTKTA